VREAFRELVSEGWLEAIPHRGCRVVSWTEDDAREIFEIRLVLEPMAVGLACERMDGDTLGQLRQLCRDMEQCADRVADQPQARNQLARLNHEFHQLLIISSGNRRLINLLGSLVRGSVIRRNYANYRPHHLQRSMHHHDEIVQALEVGESGWAENLMRSHLLAGRRLHLEEPSVKSDRGGG
jgi:DNA-binding GntR family transcriptional regulator